MTRLELYELIWKEPMTHVAKRFGVSDVALRKTCIKHNIPTPPLGYWAKLAHRKRVSQPSLPPLKQGERDHIHLAIRPPRQLPAGVSAVLEAAQNQQAAPEMAIVVPKDRPKDLHAITSLVERAIRKTTANDEGFLNWGTKDQASIVVGRDSIERIIVLLDSFIRALAARGYETTANTDLEIRVENEPFKLRIYETKDRKPYQPTSADIKRQAEYDNNSKRYPTLYPPGKTVWRTWDHYPSGRLCIEITDPTQHRWKDANLIGRWYDRKTKRAEDFLGDAVVALVAGAALAKHRRAEAEEQARIRAEQAELRRRQEARRERAQRRRDYLLKKAEAYAAYNKLTTLRSVLEAKITENETDMVNRIFQVLQNLVRIDSRQFESSTINDEVKNLQLFSEDDEI